MTALSQMEQSARVGGGCSQVVHLSSVVEPHSRARSLEKAQVELEHDEREMRYRIA